MQALLSASRSPAGLLPPCVGGATHFARGGVSRFAVDGRATEKKTPLVTMAAASQSEELNLERPALLSKGRVEDASEERQWDMRLATDASEEERQWEGLATAMAIATPALLLMLLPQEASAAMEVVQQLAAAELDPGTAKLAISILGPLFAAFNLLFIVRIVMSWYPQLPVGKFPFSLAYAPTEPVLGPTRRLIPPVGGVDVAPVIWVALMSFLNEILLGQQGLLVLLSQQQP